MKLPYIEIVGITISIVGIMGIPMLAFMWRTAQKVQKVDDSILSMGKDISSLREDFVKNSLESGTQQVALIQLTTQVAVLSERVSNLIDYVKEEKSTP